MALLYDPDEKNKKKALKEISNEMFKEIIVKIQEQNKQKNQTIETKKLSSMQSYEYYEDLVRRQHFACKNTLESAKNTLIKCNMGVSKIENLKSQLEIDNLNVIK